MREVEAGKTPVLDVCCAGLSGNLQPPLAIALAEYESHCQAKGLPWSKKYNDFFKLNPNWQRVIADATPKWAQIRAGQQDEQSPTSPPLIHEAYCLVAPFDQGGCGDVFLAIDLRSAKRVVVKLPRPDVEYAASTIEQERDALLTLPKHDSLPELVYSERNAHGDLALVFDFEDSVQMSGQSGSNELQLLRWMIPLCSAVQAAHDMGVFHADIKPENVLIRDADNRPLLIDFGLSQTVMRWSRHPESRALANGTAEYFAPELCDPAVVASPRAVDVFGLGATLFYLLAGHPPFGAPTSDAAKEKSKSYDIEWERFNAGPYSDELKEICKEAIAKDPDHRFGKPEALAEALSGTTAWRRHLFRERWRRRLNWRSGAVGVALLMTMLSSFISGRATAPQADPQAMSQKPNQWEKAAIDLDVDPSKIAATDFQVTIRCRRRQRGSRAADEESDPNKGNLVVTPSRQVLDLADALEYRWGKRPWQPMYGRIDAVHQRFAMIDQRDLEIDGALSLRLGGEGPFGGGVIAGPFVYDVRLKEALSQDRIGFNRELMVEATKAYPFNRSAGGWSMLYEFVSEYEEVIEKFRFGVAPDKLNYVATKDEQEEQKFYTQYPLPKTMPLNASFAKHCEPVRTVPTLWVQIEFIDGSISEIKRYDLASRQ